MESSRSAPRPDSPRIRAVVEMDLGRGGGGLLLHNLLQGEEATASSGVCFFSGRHGAPQGDRRVDSSSTPAPSALPLCLPIDSSWRCRSSSGCLRLRSWGS